MMRALCADTSQDVCQWAEWTGPAAQSQSGGAGQGVAGGHGDGAEA